MNDNPLPWQHAEAWAPEPLDTGDAEGAEPDLHVVERWLRGEAPMELPAAPGKHWVIAAALRVVAIFDEPVEDVDRATLDRCAALVDALEALAPGWLGFPALRIRLRRRRELADWLGRRSPAAWRAAVLDVIDGDPPSAGDAFRTRPEAERHIGRLARLMRTHPALAAWLVPRFAADLTAWLAGRYFNAERIAQGVSVLTWALGLVIVIIGNRACEGRW